MRICPVDSLWIHTYIAEPYLHGIDLINAAWSGKNVTVSLSVKQRLIHWMQGALLITPFINTIVWIAWQTFGNPNNLTDCYAPETAPPPTPPPAPAPRRQIPPSLPLPMRGRSESFSFTEQKGAQTTEMRWDISYHEDEIKVEQQCSLFSATSTYLPDYTLAKYTQTIQTNRYEMTVQGKTVSIAVGEQRELITRTLEHEYPVIQDRALGMRGFILSDLQELRFYAMLFKAPLLIDQANVILRPILKSAFSNLPYAVASIAIKKEKEKVEPYGELLKVEVTPEKAPAKWFVKSEMWFDPRTGHLKKFIDKVPTQPNMIGTVEPSGRLPESAHLRGYKPV